MEVQNNAATTQNPLSEKESMSLSAMVWALKQDVRNASAKLLLISLANYADEDGVCWPSIDRLSKDCSTSRQTVMNATKRLIDLGMIKAQKRTGGSNYGARSMLYTLNTAESQQSGLSDAPKVQNVIAESQRIRPEPIKEPITRKEVKEKWKLPEGVNREAWSDFEQHRKTTKAKLTNLARTKAANRLKTLTHEQQQACVDESITSGWPGLFPDKHKGTNHEARNGHKTSAQAHDDLHHDFYRKFAAGNLGSCDFRKDAAQVRKYVDKTNRVNRERVISEDDGVVEVVPFLDS